jgi:general secretion pathway protein I
MARHSVRAFTLLEVMVAVAILAVALTAIFGSEAGAVHVAARARNTTTATLLARCKMAEIEEMVLREGLPAVSARGNDDCCEEGEVEGFDCEWEISRVVLPETMSLEEGRAEGTERGSTSGAPAAPAPEDILSGAALGGGGGNAIAALALQFAFPVLKPHLEEQVRRAKVTVRWREGEAVRSFDVVQYLVAEQPPAAVTQRAVEILTGGGLQLLGGQAGTGAGQVPANQGGGRSGRTTP